MIDKAVGLMVLTQVETFSTRITRKLMNCVGRVSSKYSLSFFLGGGGYSQKYVEWSI